jgi:hypothetical protein
VEKLHGKMVRWRNMVGQSNKTRSLRLTRNRGELAEGWYDPSTLQKAIASSSESKQISRDRTSKEQGSRLNKDIEIPGRDSKSDSDSGNESDDSVGPTLPGKEGRSRFRRMGPGIPKADDLELKRGATPSNFSLKNVH